MQIDIKVPGSKSLTNRALILAALYKNKAVIENAAICDDTNYMISGLKDLGISIEQKNSTIIVNKGNSKKGEKIEIYTGNAGTTTRFLTALSTLSESEITITGNKRMQERPIQALVDALNRLGANILSTNGCPPIYIKSKKVTGGKIALPGNISSQFLSALLMITPFAENPTVIDIEQKLYSKPYVNMTIKVMEKFGIKILNNDFKQFKIAPYKNNHKNINFNVESDASSASYIAAYSALHPEKTTKLINIHRNSLQGDIKFLNYLEKMGCTITEALEGTTIKGPQELKSLKEVDMNETPDLVMTFAILAIFTQGTTKITNIENLRIKETDRLFALESELKKLGVKVKTGKDYIEIEGNPTLKAKLSHLQKEIEIETYDDHRIAMCFGIIRDIFPSIKIKNPNCVSKSYSTFWEDLEKMENN